jgi:hypothetical protein
MRHCWAATAALISSGLEYSFLLWERIIILKLPLREAKWYNCYPETPEIHRNPETGYWLAAQQLSFGFRA